MKKILILLALTVWSAVCLAGKPGASLPGLYYSKETRSELLLEPDGQFKWEMSYFYIMNLTAEGRWFRKGNKVQLTAHTAKGEPVFRVLKEEELSIQRPAEEGTWVAIVGVPHVGPMVGVEVTFESSGGKQVKALTDENGDAQVEVIDGETWTRAGLKRNGVDAPVQWFPVPAVRSEERLAAFGVNDVAFVKPPAFEQLNLLIRGQELVVDDGSGNVVYRR